MIFTSLTLRNFGIFKSEHKLALQPVSTDKPIILIGGLNGAGKTTILDALQLTLYGKFAQCSNRGNSAYNDFLAQTINHQIDEDEKTSVELEFSVADKEGQLTVQVAREWYKSGAKINENLTVLINGETNQEISENWDDFVDEHLPRNISNLFFFDGEKIEDLAKPSTSAKIIETGMVSLLGLDLVDKLGVDLKSVDRQRRKKVNDGAATDVLNQLEREVEELELKLTEAAQAKAETATLIDSIDSQIRSAEEVYRRSGGKLFDDRENIKVEYDAAKKNLSEIEVSIRVYASGSSPLSLVEKLVQQVRDTAKSEEKTIADRETLEVVTQRDQAILSKLKPEVEAESTYMKLEALLSKDIRKRAKSAMRTTFLEVSPHSVSRYDKLFFRDLDEEKMTFKEKFKEATVALDQLESQISMIPEETSIAQVALELRQLELEKADQEELLIRRNVDEQAVAKRLQIRNEQLERSLENLNDEQIQSFQDIRLLSHSVEVQKTLKRYKNVLISKNIEVLQQQIMDCFESLTRKNSIIQEIRIDPDKFTIALIRKDGSELMSNRLSAGERQLLSISVLWGLARTSGQSMPTIIDSPLGRLDSEHRLNLIERYFPYASSQVIMLSTDTEVDQKHVVALRKHISHEYQIKYVEKIKGSMISKGYFQ